MPRKDRETVPLLKLALLGPPQLWLDEQPVTGFRTGKAQAILFFLAVTGQSHARATLAALLWGDMPEVPARTNLRKSLSELRRVVGGHVHIERERVHLADFGSVWLDVAHFEAGTLPPVAEADYTRLAAAVDLVRGDFLQGFEVRQAPDFEAWLRTEQERLRHRQIEALDRLAGHCQHQGRWADGIGYARRLLALDPLYEAAHRQLMRLFAGSGQRAAALAQFESCRHILEAEMGAPPDPETVQLYEQIRSGALPGRPPGEPGAVDLQERPVRVRESPAGIPHNLPRQGTSFVGRTQELADVQRTLANPDCRLLTLVGPGGIGKTRLAIQVAQALAASQLGQEFADGIFFVPLTAVSSAAGLAAAVAHAVVRGPYLDGASWQQVVDLLRDKHVLLVLDNLEQLVGAVEPLSGLLADAPGVKILATSREALPLVESWLYPVSGLALSAGAHTSAQDEDDAVQLFAQRAQRAQPRFSLENERAEVVRICRLVGGMPLAIELAAAWLNVLPVQEVAREIEHGLDILTARHVNTVERHRSMRTVLGESWTLLPAAEQAVFQRLSVFHGGCRPDAAAAVAGADRTLLAGLVDRTLLTLDAAGRYQMHELLRQFAGEQLAQDEPAQQAARAAHSRHYLEWLVQQHVYLASPDQAAALERLRLDFENIAAAWRWAVQHRHHRALDQALHALFELCEISGRFGDGVGLLAYFAEPLRADGDPSAGDRQAERELLGRVLARLGALQLRLDQLDLGSENLQSSLDDTSAEQERAFALAHLGYVAGRVGDVEMSGRCLRESVALYRAVGDQAGLAFALRRLAMHVQYQDFGEAQRIATEALAISREVGRPDITAVTLCDLAWIECGLGAYDVAEFHLQEGLRISESLGYLVVVAWTLDNRGVVAWCQGEAGYADAQAYLDRSLAIFRDLGNRSGCAMVMAEQALLLHTIGRTGQALELARTAVAMARSLGKGHPLNLTLIHYGAILTGAGDYGSAWRILLEALELTFTHRHYQMVTITLVNIADLILSESRATGKQLSLEQQHKVRDLLILLDKHPATWHVFRVKALRLRTTLEQPMSGGGLTFTAGPDPEMSLDAIVAEILDCPPARVEDLWRS